MNTPNTRHTYNSGDAVRFTGDAPAPSGHVAAGAIGIVLAAQLGGANAHVPGFLMVVTFSDGRDPVLCHEQRVEPVHAAQTRRSGEGRERPVACRQMGCRMTTFNHGARCNLHTVQHEAAGMALTPQNEAEARAWGMTFEGPF